MRIGGTCELFYPGCPTRPSADQDYENCWVVRFTYENNETDWFADEWKLTPLDDVFYEKETFVEEKEETEEEIERKKALKDVLDDIIKCRIGSTDLMGQIKAIPNASENSKKIACNYLQLALDTGKVK
jgi:hypothetical protein